ncbi:hypothetical protein Uis4E_0715 [Bifidobacterium parmae]|uniref:Uncharacterized protein n=2 Tax=Bifidobacterium parmae TaxID=361854 RepID=A0A2N5J4M4_9BIFI|nr:hypothetical protein Uis4E_0715 [Bifidobacterium parmae]
MDATMMKTARQARRHRTGRQTHVMMRRCAGLYAAVLGVGVVLAAIGGGVRYLAMQGRWHVRIPYALDGMLGAGAADVESLTGLLLFAAGLIWFLAFVGPELCHGVNRRSLAVAPAACGVAAAALSAVAMTVLEYGLADRVRQGSAEVMAGASPVYGWWGNDLYQTPFSYRFLYAWQYVPASTGGAAKVSGIIPGGWLFMGAACFALMLAAMALGLLAGAAAAWACAGGVKRFALSVGAVVVAYVAAMRLFLFNGSVTLAWLAQAMTGEVVRYGSNWNEWHLYVAWIPFVEAVALFAVCVAVARRLTMRREVHAARRWAI